MLLVLPGRRSKLLRVVGPGAAKHPVVETLAALAEPAAGSVVRSGDVAVQRHRDRRDNTRHGCASTHSGLGTLDEAPSRKSSVCARAAREKRSGGGGPSGGAAEQPERKGTLELCRLTPSARDSGEDLHDQPLTRSESRQTRLNELIPPRSHVYANHI